MRIVEFDSPEAMWQACEALLSCDAANYTQTLSALQRLRRDGARHDEKFFAALDANDAVIGTVLRVDTKNAFLSCITHEVSRLLGGAVRDRRLELGGVVGVAETVRAFTQGYDKPTRPFASLMLYRHGGEVISGDAIGRARVATEADLVDVVRMLDAYTDELKMFRTSEPTEDRASRRIAAQEILMWQVGESVTAMAAANPLPANSSRIGPVYVIPEHRRRGVAQAVTAATTRHVQRDGPRTVFLFTDASNPASNKAYQRIGYRHIADHLHLLF